MLMILSNVNCKLMRIYKIRRVTICMLVHSIFPYYGPAGITWTSQACHEWLHWNYLQLSIYFLKLWRHTIPNWNTNVRETKNILRKFSIQLYWKFPVMLVPESKQRSIYLLRPAYSNLRKLFIMVKIILRSVTSITLFIHAS